MGASGTKARPTVSALLERAVERRPLDDPVSPGFSGARLERVRLADGTRLVVKRLSPQTDLTMRFTHDPGRAALLWTSGVLDRLPAGVEHAIVAAEPAGDGWLIASLDISAALLPDERVLSRDESRRILAAAAAVHETFRGEDVPFTCPLESYLTLLSPESMRRVQRERDDDPLSPMVLRGWELFDAAVPRDVAGAVREVHAHPERLAAELRRYEMTLLHGDLWLANIGLLPDRVIFFDWGLATLGPPALELTMYLTGAWSRIRATREEIIDDFRELCGARHDERALLLSFLATFANFGWNKALDVLEHPDPAIRAREAADLAWWVARVRGTLGS